MVPFVVIIAVLALALVIRLVAGTLDRERISQTIWQHGGEMLSCQWQLFGPGWLGDRNRIYLVRYRDREGHEHEAYCKTGILSGVYLTDDWIVGRARPDEAARAETDETRRAAVAAPARIAARLDHAVLGVHDVDECIAFYRATLGWEVLHPSHGPRRAVIGASGAALVLTEEAEQGTDVAPAPHVVLACRPADFVHIVERVRRSGAQIVAGLRAQGHGEMLQFRDPAGPLVEVCYPGLARART